MSKVTRAIAIVLFCSLLACAGPVNRQTPPPPPPAAPVQKNLVLPDLKKRIWVLKFGEPAASAHERVNVITIVDLVQNEMRKALEIKDSPFLSQTNDDEQAFVGLQLDRVQDPAEIARRLRGSDVAGFLHGRISRFDVEIQGGDSPGLLKSRTFVLHLGVEYELYDTNTGRVIASGRETQSHSETRSDFLGSGTQIPEQGAKARSLARELARKIQARLVPMAEKLAWSGRVLRIEGGRVYVNAGRLSGLIVGDVLKVIEAPKEIEDPQSGGFVGSAPGRMKATIKVLQYFGNDGAIGVLQSGGGIFPGDRVELY